MSPSPIATMLVFLLLLCQSFAQGGVNALPVPVVNEYVSSTCYDIRYCRTIWNIVWSCLVTIFSCTWVVVHRNIPGPNSRLYTIALERGEITLCALVAPEYILTWAIRQWLVAGQIKDEMEKIRIARECKKIERGQMVCKRDDGTETKESDELAARKNGRIASADEDVAEKNRVFSLMSLK